MMKKILFLALLLSVGLGTTAMADLVDEFDVAHNYLTSGVTGTGWTALMNSGNATTLDASITLADDLYIHSTAGDWGWGDNTGPFLYKKVTGDFVAEIKVDAANWEHFACGGLMVRATGGSGENMIFLAYWPVSFWNVGTILWYDVDSTRTETDNSGYNEGVIPPYLKVERRGANFYLSRSNDGETWDMFPSGAPLLRDDMDVPSLQVGLVQSLAGWAGQNIYYDSFTLTETPVALSLLGSTSVKEEGATSTSLTVDLTNGAPTTAPVNIVLTELSTGEPNDLLLDGVAGPLTLSFGIGETQKTVTVQAIDDELQEGPEVIKISAKMSSADPGYTDRPDTTWITVKVTDNEPGLLIDEGDGVYVDEDGTITDSVSIQLSTQPTADVTVTISSPDGQLNETSLIFTSADWNVPQSAMITAVDDTDIEADPHTGTLSFSATSDDPDYQGVTAFDVEATIAENECGAWGYSAYDYNEDCVVNLMDLAELASQWSQCTLPYVEGCIDVR